MKFGIRKIFFGDKKMKRRVNDKILTGIPRSGTTLACRLLSDMPNVIALNEPLEGSLFPDRQTAIKNIDNKFGSFRKSLLKDKTAVARNKSGKLVDNAYDSQKENRKLIIERSEVYFDKKLDKNFDLILKHNAGFSLLLPELKDKYSCFASIRNPLAILGSWSSVNVPVSRGKVAKSKKLLPSFYYEIETKDNLLEKQLFILSWYFESFTILPEENIIRYEDLILSNGKALNAIVPNNYSSDEMLKSRNNNPIYDNNLIEKLGESLLKSEGAYWRFYQKADVEKLLETYLNEK